MRHVCSAGEYNTREALLVFNRKTYVMAQVDGTVKVFKAAGIYNAAKDGDIVETVIYFHELDAIDLDKERSFIKEFFDIAAEVCPVKSDDVRRTDYGIIVLGWHPPVGQYASSIPTKKGEWIATITRWDKIPTCRDVRQLAKRWLGAFAL